jgi:hypothetical protein
MPLFLFAVHKSTWREGDFPKIYRFYTKIEVDNLPEE